MKLPVLLKVLSAFERCHLSLAQLILPELHLQLGHRWASRWCSGTVPLCKILGLWFQVITWLHPPLALHGWWPNRIAAILAPSSASRTGAFTLTCLKMSQAQAINPKDAAEINMRAAYTHTHTPTPAHTHMISMQSKGTSTITEHRWHIKLPWSSNTAG